MLLWCSSWLVKLGGDVSDTLVSAMLTKTELCLGAVLAGWQLLGRGCSPGRLAAAKGERVQSWQAGSC